MNEQKVWICPQCMRENTGRFCTTCGREKPEDAEMIIPAEPMNIPELDAEMKAAGIDVRIV